MAVGSVRCHVDDEPIASTGIGQTYPCIDMVGGADVTFKIDRLDLYARHVAEQVANRIYGVDVPLFSI